MVPSTPFVLQCVILSIEQIVLSIPLWCANDFILTVDFSRVPVPVAIAAQRQEPTGVLFSGVGH